MDSGIWATWYDLSEDRREDHQRWLHGSYLPGLLGRPGIAWAAHYQHIGGGAAMQALGERLPRGPAGEMGSGTQFVVLVGAASPHVFFRPESPIYADNQEGETRRRLGQRAGARPCVFVEEARVTGPDYGLCEPGGVTGPAIQTGSFRVRTPEDEIDLGGWYAQYRLPHMAGMPGAMRTRKLACVAGWAKHSVLYEFTSLEARLKYFEEPHEALALDEREWTSRIVKYTIHAPGSPTVGQRLWPPVK